MRLFLRGFKEGMYCFGELISILFNTVLLFAAYIFVVGPIAIIARLVGKKFLRNENSGWSDLDEKEATEESFYRQF